LVQGHTPLPPVRWLGFAIGWPGMRPRTFAEKNAALRIGASPLLRDGLLRIAAGAVFLFAARLIWERTGSPWGAPPLLLVRLSLILHFGLFPLAAALWRLAGFPCKPIFRAPLLSTSLSEFWAKRWNIAFSEMIQLSVYRPLARRLGNAAAALAGFLFSGLLHE